MERATVASRASAARGDVVIFKHFSHCGLIVSVVDEKNIITLEGNTNGSGGREGDGVYYKKRFFGDCDIYMMAARARAVEGSRP